MAVKGKIQKVLIANRGEIAFRISKTLKKMKIASVGLCIANEQKASSFSMCDEVCIFSRNELSSYLDINEIISWAKKSKADAIHPGYGFLSENPSFAAACTQNGILFIGPESATIELMGNKNEAKVFAKSCGIPVLETVVEKQEFDSQFEKNIRKLHLPIILKPLSGGGGKGMVILKNWNDLKSSLEEGRNIAKKAFGDARLLAEPFIEKALHLEVQIIGDTHGNVRHLFERDCTVQRRHQKIIEETPSSLIPSEMLNVMIQHAVTIGQKSQYQNLGTVEFIVDRQNFYFMEMNTRLQVEHPVTEITLGLDLVEKQIKIAEGAVLSKILPPKLKQKGHGIEVRIYTETPRQDFLPSTGVIEYLKLPKETKHLRIDCGIEQGNRIHHLFDPMIMKITAHGSSRPKTIEALLLALRKTMIFGVHTNIDYLQWVLQHEDFTQAQHFTAWTGQTIEEFQKYLPYEELLVTIVESFELEKRKRDSEWYFDPWLSQTYKNQPLIIWKKNSFVWQDMFSFQEKNLEGFVSENTHAYWISINGLTYTHAKHEKSFEEGEQIASNLVRAPMTGSILQINVHEGDTVKKSDVLVEMEAMKMQYKIQAPQDGKVSKILCQLAEIVEHESVLIEMEKA